MSLFGIKVVESPFAYMTVPNRKLVRKRWMSDTYFRRVQKKWTRRFGTHQEPCALFLSPRAVGLGMPDMLALPPGHIGLIRNLA